MKCKDTNCVCVKERRLCQGYTLCLIMIYFPEQTFCDKDVSTEMKINLKKVAITNAVYNLVLVKVLKKRWLKFKIKSY